MSGLQVAEQYMLKREFGSAIRVLSEINTNTFESREDLYAFYTLCVETLLCTGQNDTVCLIWDGVYDQIVSRGTDSSLEENKMVFSFHMTCACCLDPKKAYIALGKATVVAALFEDLDMHLVISDAYIGSGYLPEAILCLKPFCNKVVACKRMLQIARNVKDESDLIKAYQFIFPELSCWDDSLIRDEEIKMWILNTCMHTKNFTTLTWFAFSMGEANTLIANLMTDISTWKVVPVSRRSRLRMCASCFKFKHGMRKCSRCMLFYYCDETCNIKGWKYHKKWCKAIL